MNFNSGNHPEVRIAIIEDDAVFAKLAEETVRRTGIFFIKHYLNPGDFISESANQEFDIALIDYNIPLMNGLEVVKKIKADNDRIKTIIVSGQTDVQVVVDSYAAGADDYIVKNENCLFMLGNSIKNLAANVRLRKEVEILRSTLSDRGKYPHILGNSKAIITVLHLIEKAERSNIMVMITGSSGTGKELVAKAIHENSPRRKKPFVPVNMAAIPKDLVESELFGHEKGSFTGAIARRIGKFEEANDGTLFLDEIGEMDLQIQVKLLRIIEDKMLVRVGSNTQVKLDIRIIAATNRDLLQEVKKGLFREELYYRLQGLHIHLPDLKDRKEDILLLAKAFLGRFTKENNMPPMSIPAETAAILENQPWKGNVRELKSVMERAALLSNDNRISPGNLMLVADSQQGDILSEEMTMEDYKMLIIRKFLDKYDNKMDIVARKLNIGKATLYRALKKMDVGHL